MVAWFLRSYIADTSFLTYEIVDGERKILLILIIADNEKIVNM